METIINILELAAVLVWIAAAVYAIYTTRHLNKRCNKALDDMEAELKRNQEGA